MLARLDKRMCSQFNLVMDIATDKGLSPRMAAYGLVLKRIGAAVEAMGTASLFDGD